MSTPPLVEEIESRIYSAIEQIGDEKSLQLLEKLSPEIPRWVKLHLQMQHTYPSPSNITRCRYQLWLNARTAYCPLHGKPKPDLSPSLINE